MGGGAPIRYIPKWDPIGFDSWPYQLGVSPRNFPQLAILPGEASRLVHLQLLLELEGAASVALVRRHRGPEAPRAVRLQLRRRERGTWDFQHSVGSVMLSPAETAGCTDLMRLQLQREQNKQFALATEATQTS